MKHQTDRVHIRFFHILGLSELHCHLKFSRLKKAILMKKNATRRVLCRKIFKFKVLERGKKLTALCDTLFRTCCQPDIHKQNMWCLWIYTMWDALPDHIPRASTSLENKIRYLCYKIYALYVKIYHSPSPTPFGKYSIV